MTTPEAFAAALRPGLRIFLGDAAGQPDAVLDALAARPEALAGATLIQVPVPGANRRDLSALAPVEVTFMTPELRPGLAAGRVAFRPMHYSAGFRWLRDAARPDLAVFRCSAPRDGRVSLALAHDFVPAAAAAGAGLVGVVDPALPFVPDGMELEVERLHALVDGPSPSPELSVDAPDAAMRAIGLHVAKLVREGDTVQAGIGGAADAALRALRHHRRLRYHGGMLADAVLELMDAGAIDGAVCAVALGSSALYARLAGERRIGFRPVGHTHDAGVLGAIPRLVAINAAVEVDLLGQVNSEMIGGRQVSGHGGVADFVRAARGRGRAVFVLPATGRGGAVSRIVAKLPAGTPVSVTRADIDVVATEFGAVELADLPIDERAERLIGIAAPQFRDALAGEWAAMRRAM
ncbi:acetyl-CoA hydrolase/transferase C-terminal domain-containing protein [Falsiroseomonas sp. CW058]|uniref:acetyl-CoA hydrolase/transferase C-terminal domain-containing protein n=1 Tax=Falsiroseomonas sp. CW058 TaxID=3388664 RepID=UPI003D323132